MCYVLTGCKAASRRSAWQLRFDENKGCYDEYKISPAFVADLLLLAPVFSQSLYADSGALKDPHRHLALNDPKLADAKYLLQRRKLARVVLEQLFDFREMSRRSLGANARRYSDRLGEFTPLFVDFLEHAYMGKLEEYGDAKIQYVREIVDDENVEIDTKTRLKDGNEYSVNYKLYLGPWVGAPMMLSSRASA